MYFCTPLGQAQPSHPLGVEYNNTLQKTDRTRTERCINRAARRHPGASSSETGMAIRSGRCIEEGEARERAHQTRLVGSDALLCCQTESLRTGPGSPCPAAAGPCAQTGSAGPQSGDRPAARQKKRHGDSRRCLGDGRRASTSRLALPGPLLRTPVCCPGIAASASLAGHAAQSMGHAGGSGAAPSGASPGSLTRSASRSGSERSWAKSR